MHQNIGKHAASRAETPKLQLLLDKGRIKPPLYPQYMQMITREYAY